MKNLNNEINSIELSEGASKNPFCHVNDFITAMMEDLDLLFTDIRSIWNNYMEMIRLKPNIISNISK